MRTGALAAAFALAACGSGAGPAAGDAASSQAGVADSAYLPPVGSNEVFRAVTAAAPGHELIVADLNLPADAVGDAHSHPWEEFLYVIGGSAVLDVEGMEGRVLNPGESFVIPPQRVHTPRAGPTGVRAIVVRVHDEGDPITVQAGE